MRQSVGHTIVSCQADITEIVMILGMIADIEKRSSRRVYCDRTIENDTEERVVNAWWLRVARRRQVVADDHKSDEIRLIFESGHRPDTFRLRMLNGLTMKDLSISCRDSSPISVNLCTLVALHLWNWSSIRVATLLKTRVSFGRRASKLERFALALTEDEYNPTDTIRICSSCYE